MSMSSGSGLTGRAEREADMKDIDIDDVRQIDTEGEGQTIRVIYESGPTEKDEVGFQVTKPPGPMGEQMFQERLSNGFTELRNYISGNSADDDSDDTNDRADGDKATVAETPDDDPRGGDTESSSSPTDGDTASTADAPATTTTEHELTLAVDLNEDATELLESQLAEIASELNELEGVSATVSDNEERLDDLEARVEKVESSLNTFVDTLNAPGDGG